ncbi:hypothetical protein RRG08_060981 [Elysia crispata]|uniref:Uncharacterized protein n=1 Tax=Elysia crispata TaxID=231223 RepID=A0AAE1E4V2_9GAST|nr:hypothetical protein RRG08_060981 [Elysia crispata]
MNIHISRLCCAKALSAEAVGLFRGARVCVYVTDFTNSAWNSISTHCLLSFSCEIVCGANQHKSPQLFGPRGTSEVRRLDYPSFSVKICRLNPCCTLYTVLLLTPQDLEGETQVCLAWLSPDGLSAENQGSRSPPLLPQTQRSCAVLVIVCSQLGPTDAVEYHASERRSVSFPSSSTDQI